MFAGWFNLELFELYFQLSKTTRKNSDPKPNWLCNPCTIQKPKPVKMKKNLNSLCDENHSVAGLFASFFPSAWSEKAHIHPGFRGSVSKIIFANC